MLSGGTIITTAILSYFMIGRKLKRHHILGCSLATCGFILVGIASLINEDAAKKSSSSGMLLGVLMVTASVFTQGTMSNVEEILLSKYEVDVQRMVGIEGFFGIIWIFMWIMIFSFVPCPDESLCEVIFWSF